MSSRVVSASGVGERRYSSAGRLSDYPPVVKPRPLPRSAIQTHPSPSWRRFLPSCSNSLLFIVITLSCLSTTSLSILLALIAAPIVTSLMLTCLALAVMFVLTESSALGIWHHNRESENRFWIVVTLLFTASLFFAPDSPLGFGLSHRWLAVCLMLAAALFVNHYDRQLSRTSLLRTPHLRRVSSVLLIDQQKAKDKLRIVSDALEALDYRFVLLKGIRSASITAAETAIVQAFEEASPDELNYIVTNVNLSLCLYKLKDRDILVWKSGSLLSRTRLIHLLCITKLPLLHTAARVSIIDALMNLRLKAHIHAEDWICNVICNTRGRALTRLKTACDAKGSISNLHKLVFRDISNLRIRQQILAHIAHEASLLSSSPHATHRRKILSDVDDTLFSSGGKFPAGIDASFPVRTVYPGVLSFYKELDLGLSLTGDWSSGRLGNLVFLSARPHVYKDKAESKSYLHFEQLRVQAGIGLHCVPTLLAGSLDSGWRMVFRGDFAALARTKYDNFLQFAALYPEFAFVFIGDNGQGDVMAADLMQQRLGDRLEAVFIKLCQPVHLTPGWSLQARERWRRFVFFQTFVGAATEAAKAGLIHSSAVLRIGSHAISRLLEMKDVLNVTDFDARRREMNADIEQANAFLLQRQLALLPFIRSESQYPIGAHVWTLFGLGQIADYEPVNSVYKVQLLEWTLADASHPVLHQHSSEVDLVVVGSPGSRVWTPFGTGVLLSIRNPGSIHCISLTSWNATLPGETAAPPYAKAFLQASECRQIIAAVGELVFCHPFGYGVVTRYRPEDGVYEVELRLSGELSIGAQHAKDSKAVAVSAAGKAVKGKARPVVVERKARRRGSMLYTVGTGMRRVDEEERKNRSCVVM